MVSRREAKAAGTGAMPTFAAIAAAIATCPGTNRYGRQHRDPLRVATALLTKAATWQHDRRLHDEHDRAFQKRGSKGARKLAEAILAAMREHGAITGEIADELLLRYARPARKPSRQGA